MRVRHLLLVSAASIGLAMTATGLPSAYAQKGDFLKPSSTWAVTKVAGNPSAGQAGYCAVAKKYGDDAILTIAKNHGDETSFALDLQKPVFALGQSLSVTLDPGAGEQRDYSISPASEQAFVVRLGRDDAFFKAVDRTGLLRVEAAGQTYVFNIADIEAGQSKLSSCLSPAKSIETQSSPSVFPTEVQTTSNKEFIDELKARIQSLENENKTLHTKILHIDADPLKRAGVDSSAPPALKAEVLRAENLRLKAALQTEVVEQQSEELKALQADNKRLQEQISRQSQASDNVEMLQERVDTLLEEKMRLEDESSDEIAALKNQVEHLKVSQKQDFEDNQTIEALKVELTLLRQDNLLLQQELYEKGDTVGALADANIKALEFENKKLQSRIQKSLHAHELQNRAIESLERENIALKSKASSFIASSASVERLSKQLVSLQEKLAESEQKRASQGSRLAVLTGENNALKEALDERVSDSASLARALNDVTLLKEEIAQKDAQLAAFEDVPERLQSLLASYKKVQDEKQVIEAELAASKVQHELNEEEKENVITALRDDNAALKQQKDINHDLMTQLARAETKNKLFEEKLNSLQENVVAMSKLNQEVKDLQLALGEKQQEIDTLKQENVQVIAKNTQIENDAVEGHEKLADENLELRKTLSSALDRLAQYKDDFAQILAQKEVLKGQLDLAAHLIEGAEKDRKKSVVVRAVDQKDEPEAGVILASAKTTPAKPKAKPVIKRVKKEDTSFAEHLAQIEPAAGEEEKALETIVEEFTQEASPEDVPDVVQETPVIEPADVVEDAEDFMDRDLNQAQIYEEQLKRSLNNQQLVEESRSEPIEVETLEENVVDEVIEGVAGSAELPSLDDPIETEALVEEPVEIRMSQDPFEGIEAKDEDGFEDEEIETVVIETDIDELEAAPLPKKVKQPKSAPVRAADSSPAVMNSEAISRVLRLANVPGAGDIKTVDSKDNAYQWRVGSLYGSGEQRIMSSFSQFDGLVKDYLDRTESRCPGDFAIVPDNSKESGSMRVDSYEIACIGSNVSSGASLVFYNDGDVFTVLAHETEATSMDEAMMTRDKLFNSLASGRDS